MAQKTIKVNSTVETRLPLHYLKELQGDLKDHPEKKLLKLERSIIRKGFIFPFFVWESPEDAQIYIIDGHGRKKVMKRLMDKGYKIPDLPIILIEAATMQEAKENLIAATSQYGDFTAGGVESFFKDLKKLDFDFAEIPFLNIELNLKDEVVKTIDVGGHTREIKNTSAEIDLENFKNFQHKCPKCSFEWNEK